MYASNARWKADWISKTDLEKILSQLTGKILPSPYDPDHIGLSHGLHFIGGEPFLNFELLCNGLEIVSALNIPSFFVETNCLWCTDDKNTKEKLFTFRGKGLKGIMISVNPFYLEYVPFERTERVVRIATEVSGYNATCVLI